ncbi:MAG: hypothetical protein KDM91_16770, partial [Verrucomicrobiae bacterium]|nr:hypothetical protein [Verrucomicrobiae bacterium]
MKNVPAARRARFAAMLAMIVAGSFSGLRSQNAAAPDTTTDPVSEWRWHDQSAEYFGAPLDDATVIRVTNLDSSGPGSLREALETEMEGARLIVFEVGGVIDLGGRGIKIRHEGTWIAGQTAPAPGVTLIRGGLSIEASHVILQHLRVRPGDRGDPEKKKWEPDGISTGGPIRDVLVEHCSVTWSVDENLSASSYGAPEGEGARRIAFRECLVAEALNHATHGEGEHSKGSLVLDGTHEVAIVGCLYAANVERNPVFKLDTSGVVVNCVMACNGQRAIHASVPEADYPGKPARLAVVGNTVLLGPDSKTSSAIFEGTAEGYFRDNAGADAEGRPLPELRRTFSTLKKPPVWPLGLPVKPAAAAAWHVARFAGARPAERDPIDRRIVERAMSGELRVIDSQEQVGGYPKAEPPVVVALEVPEKQRDVWLEDLARAVEGRTQIRATSKRPGDLAHFAAATVHPLATAAAVAAFDRGGNAIDGAIAAAVT